MKRIGVLLAVPVAVVLVVYASQQMHKAAVRSEKKLAQDQASALLDKVRKEAAIADSFLPLFDKILDDALKQTDFSANINFSLPAVSMRKEEKKRATAMVARLHLRNTDNPDMYRRLLLGGEYMTGPHPRPENVLTGKTVEGPAYYLWHRNLGDQYVFFLESREPNQAVLDSYVAAVSWNPGETHWLVNSPHYCNIWRNYVPEDIRTLIVVSPEQRNVVGGYAGKYGGSGGEC